MMISPETYYEMNLKGKSPKEIMKKIRFLKTQIGQLKRSIENADDIVCEVFPGRLQDSSVIEITWNVPFRYTKKLVKNQRSTMKLMNQKLPRNNRFYLKEAMKNVNHFS